MTVSVTMNGKAVIHPYLVKDSSSGVWTLQVMNTRGFELPNTGGSGTRAYTIFGLAVVVGAFLALVRRRARAAA